MSAARFIVFEGGEGCGKSTQAALLAERLAAVLTRQPGGTALGRSLRALLLAERDDSAGGAPMDPRAEALLMAADRAQHEAEVIGPALAAGRHVVCDRYIGSSVAYQGHGRGLAPDEVAHISEWAVGGRPADLVVLLEVDPDEAARRRGAPSDRIESAGAEFHRRVAAGFRAQADAAPDRWVVVDGSGPVETVAARVDAAVSDRLGL
ncbi:MAG: dTMP kinase [Microthrixaceae bacterium]